jgi:GGDEF domain-containing protein
LPRIAATFEKKDGILVTNLKRSFFWAALYLAMVFILGQTDYFGRPIINFASYFYLAVMIGVPATLFFPSVSKVSSFVPLAVWAVIYLMLLLFIDRARSTSSNEFSVIALEFVLLEIGIWFAHQLALQITNAESVMDELAIDTFPHRAQEMDEGNQRVKLEFTRSRRYHRPLAVLLLEVDPDFQKRNGEVLKTIQHDIMNRLTSARIGQIIDGRIRQTDLVLRDKKWCYVMLCPETDHGGVLLLARRISDAVKEKTGLSVLWGIAAFPEEALTFDDLLKRARERLTLGELPENVHQPENVEQEIFKV